MKRLLKRVLQVCSVMLAFIMLVSCDKNIEIYRNYNKNGSSLTKNHVYQYVSVKQIIAKLDNQGEEVIYVFYGTHTDTNSGQAIQIFNEQAKQFGISTIYYLDSNLKSKDYDKIRNRLNMSRPKKIPAIYAFYNGEIIFDSSIQKFENDNLTYAEIATKAFKNLEIPS